MNRILLLIGLYLLGPQKAHAEVIWYPMPVEAYTFGDVYPEAQHLLFAFDYGHALVYERLINSGGTIQNPEQFEKEMLATIMGILRNPPTTKVDESDIAPQYVYTFPLTVSLFDWSHMLHQFVLDVLATSKDRGSGMVHRIDEIFAQYQAKKPLLITDVCKTMLFMDGQRVSMDGQKSLQSGDTSEGQLFSKVFRRKFPSFNLLIWSYHWFQIKLYEALLKPTKTERDQGVAKTVADFRQLISDLPDSADFVMMPETAKEAPNFARLFPSIPSAFDNNHMLHDIISDILTSDLVKNKRHVGFDTARMAQNPAAFRTETCGQ